MPHERVPFEVETDVSEFAIAATLNQKGRPVTFFSHTLQGSEIRHASVEKEAQAIIETIHHWKHYLTGRHFCQMHYTHSVLSCAQQPTAAHTRGSSAMSDDHPLVDLYPPGLLHLGQYYSSVMSILTRTNPWWTKLNFCRPTLNTLMSGMQMVERQLCHYATWLLSLKIFFVLITFCLNLIYRWTVVVCLVMSR